MQRRHSIALLALFGALAPVALAAEPEPERDDPRERLRESEEWRGEQSTAARWRILQEARKERDRSGGPSSLPRRQASTFLQQQALQGSTFVNIGPSDADFEMNGGKYLEVDSGRARQVVVHPADPNILYLASAGGGVWKTWDAGGHWEPITDMLGTTAIGALAMDPLNPEILYLGFGDPFDVHQPGLVRSTDGGATWSEPVQLSGSGGTAASVTSIQVDPANSAIVFATTDVGLFRSTDAGGSWVQMPLVDLAGNGFFYMWSVTSAGAGAWLASGQVADPTKPVSLTTNVTQLGLWRSSDSGATWAWNGAALPGGDATVGNAGRATLVTAGSTLIDPDTSRIFLLAATVKGDAQLDLYRSEDGGRSFVALGMNASGTPSNPNANQPDTDALHQQAWYNQAVAVDPLDPDLVFVGGDLSILRSVDGGNSWSVISNWLPVPQNLSNAYVHADLHSLAIGPVGDSGVPGLPGYGMLYAGSDGGIFASPDARTAAAGVVSFTSHLNRGIVTHQLYSVACAPETWPPDMQGWMGGGLQDNGTRFRSGTTTTFNQLLGGDGIGLAVSAGTHVDPVLQAGVPDALLASAEFKLFRSTDGGQSWLSYAGGMGSAQLPFFVRVTRDVADPDGQAFVTFTGTPASVFRTSAGLQWSDISGVLHWQDSGADTKGFVTKENAVVGLRNIAAHPLRAGLYGAISNKFAYVTTDLGTHWLVSLQPAPADAPAGTGAWLLSSIAFDYSDVTGKTYYVTSKAMDLADAKGNSVPMPASFGHLYKTSDGGLHWTSLGTQALGAGGLPFVPIQVIAVDPGDSRTLYAGTALGLYRSVDGGANWSRFGAGSLPLVEVADLCISPASKRLTVATYGRGFWQIGTDAGSDPAGVRGNGDTNFDQRIDGLDLIDLADAYGSSQASASYRWQADLTGTVNKVDADDLTALLARFGGTP